MHATLLETARHRLQGRHQFGTIGRSEPNKKDLELWLSGRKRRLAKPVNRLSVPWVRIPAAPLFSNRR